MVGKRCTSFDQELLEAQRFQSPAFLIPKPTIVPAFAALREFS